MCELFSPSKHGSRRFRFHYHILLRLKRDELTFHSKSSGIFTITHDVRTFVSSHLFHNGSTVKSPIFSIPITTDWILVIHSTEIVFRSQIQLQQFTQLSTWSQEQGWSSPLNVSLNSPKLSQQLGKPYALSTPG